MGDAKHPFIFISIAAVVNVVLDILFVWGLGMGAGGAALATVISQGISFVACAIFLVRSRQRFELEFKRELFLHWNGEMLAKITLPIATFLSACFILFPNQIFGIFTDEAEVLEIGKVYVPIAVMLFFGSAMRCIMNALMNGSGNHRINFVTAILDKISILLHRLVEEGEPWQRK